MEDIKEIVLEPDAARVMQGLRDTGYDFNTAMADIVDNSIAAEATLIKVRIELDPINSVRVYIADNGIGMDMEGLKNAMRYGSPERIDPSSLGKFGLGLKTASTAFCRSLSVLSKDKNNNKYHKVEWDIDEICRVHRWNLLIKPINDEEVELLEDVTNGGSGTLIIWDKVDRLLKDYAQDSYKRKAFEKMINNLIQHFAMIYQRYLDREYTEKPIEIYVNDTKVEPWDPFCTKHPHSKLLVHEKKEVELPDGSKSHFELDAWLLPRVDQFKSKEEKTNARISNDMEGFYVYRENRLIHYGDWLGMFVKDPHISLLRINFSFTHELDAYFNVDIKKSRILLDNAIYEYLLNSFIPAPRREAENVYRKGQNEKVKKGSKGVHEESNNNINSKASSVEGSKISIIDENKGTVSISNSNGQFIGTLKIQHSTEPNQLRVVPAKDIENGILWEPTIVDGNHAVSINQSHIYYSKVYAPNIDNKSLIVGMDSLLWALSEAELSTYNEETKEQYEDMRIQVSRIIKKLVSDLPDPDIEDNNENN